VFGNLFDAIDEEILGLGTIPKQFVVQRFDDIVRLLVR
jgi:hypothetical protein